MGVLGKDLLDFHRPRTNTKVEFGASGYWVESHPTMQPYGAVLTEILNLDAAPFQELLDQYRKAVAENNAEQAARAFQAATNGFASLPLYRLYWDDVQLFASMDVRELFVGEAQEAFCEYAVQDDTLPRFMQEQLDAIRLIQDRYVWFLDSLFAVVVASCFVAGYAFVMSRVNHAPSTVFLTASVFPLMPGARLYYLMYGVVSRNFSLAAEHALVLLETCLGIAFGFIIVDVISRSIMRALGREYHMGKESTVIKKEKK